MTHIDSLTYPVNDSSPIPDFLPCAPANTRPDLGCTVQPKTEAGQRAWARLKTSQTWSDWKVLGIAIAEGRTVAMAEAKTNKPEGRAYNKAFSTLLIKQGFADLEKATRARLLRCVENLDAIEAWLAQQEPAKRLRLNHPVTVWNSWKRATKPQPAIESEIETTVEIKEPVEVEPKIDHTAQLLASWEAAHADARRAFLTKALVEIGTATLLGMLPEARRLELESRACSSLIMKLSTTTKGERELLRKLSRKLERKKTKLAEAKSDSSAALSIEESMETPKPVQVMA
jgi:hypothetical protein